MQRFHAKMKQRTARTRGDLHRADRGRGIGVPLFGRLGEMRLGASVSSGGLGQYPQIGIDCRPPQIVAVKHKPRDKMRAAQKRRGARSVAPGPGLVDLFHQPFPKDIRAAPASGARNLCRRRSEVTPPDMRREHVRCHGAHLRGPPRPCFRFPAHRRDPPVPAPVRRFVRPAPQTGPVR